MIPAQFVVTRFVDFAARAKSEREFTAEQLAVEIQQRRAPDKEALPWLKLARFGDIPSDKGCLRNDKNVLAFTGIEADYDGELVAFEAALDTLRGASIEAIAYTSPSHSPEKPRWRVLCPFSEELPPDRRDKMMSRLNGLFSGIFAGESFALSQSYFYGAVNGNAAHRVERIAGRRIDLCDDLDATARGKANGADRAVTRPPVDGAPDRSRLNALPEKWRCVIRDGVAPEKDGDRSRALAAAAKALVNAGWADGEIAATLLDRSNGISAHPYEQSDPARAVQRALDLAHRVEPEVAGMNEHHAVILVGDKVVVLRETTTSDGRFGFGLITVAALKQWFAPRLVHRENAKGEPVAIPLADFWLKSPQRRQYEGLTFAPGRDAPGYYNLWRGFAIQPRAGDCSLFLAHVMDNVCRGDANLCQWVIGWFAALIQHPERKVGTSLVIRGKQGTGKSKVGEVIGSLLGDHYVAISDPRYITGRFNSHLVSCLLLHADEAFWAGDHAAEGRLKDLVTGDTQLIEYKGKEPIRVRNFVRLLVSGNPNWLVPAGMEERRFAVLEIGEGHIEDHQYFAAIDAQMDNGGREALLDHLLRLDLSTIDLRAIPKTATLLDQKLETLGEIERWWLTMLREGRLPGGCNEPNTCPVKVLYQRYLDHAAMTHVRNQRAIETQLGIALRRFMPLSKAGKPTMRRYRAHYDTHYGEGARAGFGYVYVLASLSECRRHFEKLIGQEITWDDDDVPEVGDMFDPADAPPGGADWEIEALPPTACLP